MHDFFVLAEKEGLDFAVPEFLFGSAFRFAVKIRPLQLSRLTAPVPDSVRRLPPRGREGSSTHYTAKTKRQALPVLLFWRRRRDFLRTPSLAARFHRTLASSVSQTRGGKNVSPTRFFSPFKSLQNKIKKPSMMAFLFWRRRRDLNPRASCPTYTLSRGASSPLEYFSIW